jgi:nonsense-mediated mRNA decay protein 3
VQLRGVDREPTDEERDRAKEIAHGLVDDLESKGDREAFITEINEVAGGLDIRVSTTRLGEQIARRVTNELGGEFTDHETLVTEDSDGNEVYRVTFAVRLPPYRPGEIVDPGDGDGPVLVESARETMRGIRLKTGDTYQTPFEDGSAPDADRLGWADHAEETTLVAVEDEHAVQILDPTTYETKSVPRPPSLETETETVQVFRADGELYIVPDAEE